MQAKKTEGRTHKGRVSFPFCLLSVLARAPARVKPSARKATRPLPLLYGEREQSKTGVSHHSGAAEEVRSTDGTPKALGVRGPCPCRVPMEFSES